MASIDITDIRKNYGAIPVLHGVDLTIRDGEFVVLVGPSGCGKSTLLRMIAGLEEISDGEIWVGDRVVNDLPPKDRDIAMVFQSYALYPTMTVRQNMLFGMEARGVPKPQQEEAIARVSALLQIQQLLNRKPGQLSGGQRQRVAMGRALVRDPQLFLFDEPLSNLDAKLRVEMRTEIKKLHHRVGKTTIYVTHDQVEAMTLASRIAVMHQGQVQQFDEPAVVQHHDVVGELPHDGEVVGDQQVGGAELVAELGEQVQDLRLDGDVERGDRFVEDDQPRLDGERPRDRDALPLPT